MIFKMKVKLKSTVLICNFAQMLSVSFSSINLLLESAFSSHSKMILISAANELVLNKQFIL